MMPNVDILLQLTHIRDGKVLYTKQQQSESLLKNFMHLVMVAAFGAKTTDVTNMTVKDVSAVVVTPGTNGGDFQNIGNVRPAIVVSTSSTAVSTNDFSLASVPVFGTYVTEVDTVTETISGNTVTRVYTKTFTNDGASNVTLMEAGMTIQCSVLGTNRTFLIIRDIIQDLQTLLPDDQMIATYSITITA